MPSQSFQTLPALLTLSSPLETSGWISGKNKNNNDPNITSTGSPLSSEGFVYPHPTGWICHKDQSRAVVVSPAAAAPSLRCRFVLRGVRSPFPLRNAGSAFFTQLCSYKCELVKLLGCPWTTLTHFFFFAWKNPWNVGRWVSRELRANTERKRTFICYDWTTGRQIQEECVSADLLKAYSVATGTIGALIVYWTQQCWCYSGALHLAPVVTMDRWASGSASPLKLGHGPAV